MSWLFDAFRQATQSDYEELREEDLTAWTTLDGRRILIVDMDTAHLQNTIRFVERTCREAKRPPYPVYAKLLDEARKRKLITLHDMIERLK